MKSYDSVIDALRHVKELTKNLRNKEQVFLAVDYWGETFYVTQSIYDVSTKITKDYCENSFDSKPEDVAEEWQVIEYCLAERKNNLPYTYEKAKKAKFKNGTDIIRKKLAVSAEYSVDFNVS